jgi:asparagine synthase (glutamine-hydrolysing)
MSTSNLGLIEEASKLSTILGIINLQPKKMKSNDSAQSLAEELGIMIKASVLWPHDRIGHYKGKHCVLACLQRYNTPESVNAIQPISDVAKRYQLVFDGRLDNREQLALKLDNIDISLLSLMSDEELLLKAYIKYGYQIADHLLGDFAIAIYDQDQQQLFIIRDHMGVRPLYITQNKNYFAFASNKNALLALPWVDNTVNLQKMADYLCITQVDKCSTFYKTISLLEPAHWLMIEPNKEKKGSVEEFIITNNQYWQLDSTYELAGLTDEEYLAQFKSLLYQAVECRLRSYGDVAAELSGGLDSTSITSVAADIKNRQQKGEVIYSYSQILDPEIKSEQYPVTDESYYINLLVSQYPNISSQAIYNRNKGVIEAIKKGLEVHSCPAWRDSSILTEEMFISLQQHNRRVLLSGFGGDECVTTKVRGWHEDLVNNSFSYLLKKTHYYAPNRSSQLRLYASVIKHKLKKKITDTRKVEAKEKANNWQRRQNRGCVNSTFANEWGYPSRYFDNPILAKVGTAREREFYFVNHPDLYCRLETSSVGAERYGVDYRYPLLDIRLLQFCLSLPVKQKVSRGLHRRMIRLATAGLVPDEIRLRDDKTVAMLPSVFQRFQQDNARLLNMLNLARDQNELSQFVDLQKIEQYLKKIEKADNDTVGFINIGYVRHWTEIMTWFILKKLNINNSN